MTNHRRLLENKQQMLDSYSEDTSGHLPVISPRATLNTLASKVPGFVNYKKLLHETKHPRADCLRLLDRTRPFYPGTEKKQKRPIEYDFDSSDLNSEFRNQTALYNNMMYRLNNDPNFLVRVKGSVAVAGSPAM
jgi:hypothetical protein